MQGYHIHEPGNTGGLSVIKVQVNLESETPQNMLAPGVVPKFGNMLAAIQTPRSKKALNSDSDVEA